MHVRAASGLDQGGAGLCLSAWICSGVAGASRRRAGREFVRGLLLLILAGSSLTNRAYQAEQALTRGLNLSSYKCGATLAGIG